MKTFGAMARAVAGGGASAKYVSRKAKQRQDMNKKNDPGAAKKGLALSVIDREKARIKARKKRMNEQNDLLEADLMKMSKELIKHKDKGVDYEKAAAYVRTIHNNSNVNVQDKAMKGILDLLKSAELTDRTTITKILKDNGFKVKGGRLIR